MAYPAKQDKGSMTEGIPSAPTVSVFYRVRDQAIETEPTKSGGFFSELTYVLPPSVQLNIAYAPLEPTSKSLCLCPPSCK